MVTAAQAHETLTDMSAVLEKGFPSRESALHDALSVLVRHLPHYSTVGVYLFDSGVLNLDAFVGNPPEDTLVPVGRGSVGQAAASGTDVLTNREAAVLLRDRESSHLLGVLSTTSTAGILDESDRVFLAAVAQRLAPLLWETPE